MSFKQLLQSLVQSIPGADGAVFADWEGESVDLYSTVEEADHVRFIAAHHGILLDAIKRSASSISMGETQTVVIRSEKNDYITAPVHDGYYLVLIVKPGLPLVRANIEIERAIQDLKREMGY